MKKIKGIEVISVKIDNENYWRAIELENLRVLALQYAHKYRN